MPILENVNKYFTITVISLKNKQGMTKKNFSI